MYYKDDYKKKKTSFKEGMENVQRQSGVQNVCSSLNASVKGPK